MRVRERQKEKTTEIRLSWVKTQSNELPTLIFNVQTLSSFTREIPKITFPCASIAAGMGWPQTRYVDGLVDCEPFVSCFTNTLLLLNAWQQTFRGFKGNVVLDLSTKEKHASSDREGLSNSASSPSVSKIELWELP